MRGGAEGVGVGAVMLGIEVNTGWLMRGDEGKGLGGCLLMQAFDVERWVLGAHTTDSRASRTPVSEPVTATPQCRYVAFCQLTRLGLFSTAV